MVESLRRQGTWAGRKSAMAWRMALLGSNMASLGHTSDETHKGGSKGPFLEAIQNPGTSQPASVFRMTKKMIDFVRMDKLDQTLEVRWAGLLSWPHRRRCRRFRRYVVSLNHRRRLIS